MLGPIEVLTETVATLRASEAAATEANSAKAEFLGNISHELRTPLNAISGYAQLLERVASSSLEERHRGYIRQILRASDILLDIITDISDFAKLEAGELGVSLEVQNIVPIVHSAVADMGVFAEGRGVTIEFSVPQNEAFLVNADFKRLSQVLRNIISNGIKYNRPTGRVTIGLSRDRSQSAILLSVSDTGVGIPPERIPEMFQPYRRLGAERGSVEGTGLGLAICRKLVTLMKGVVTCESHYGKGTLFTVVLPDVESRTTPDFRADHDRVDATLIAGLRILYVDDNETNRTLMVDIFETLTTATLTAAATGEEALALARNQRFDILILDIHLPDINGYDLLFRLRAEGQELEDVAAIALSAAALKSDILKGKGGQGGFLAYLTKPFSIHEFLRSVARSATADGPIRLPHARSA